MDQAPLVVDEIDAGAAFIERLNEYAPVKAAYWMRPAEDGERYLYVALEGLTERNTDDAYGEVLRIASELKDHYVDPFRVKLVSPADRVAKAVTELYRRYPGKAPTRPGEPLPGGVAAPEAYVYPQLARNP